jgi:signal transduction histidine kinase
MDSHSKDRCYNPLAMIAWKRPKITFALVAMLIILLPLLAFLQYRWLGRISEAEHDRMLESVKRDVEQFCKEFDREVTIASLVFAVKANSTGGEKALEYQSNSRRWIGASKHPGIVKDVYDVEFGKGEWKLSLFDSAAGKLQPSEWPTALLHVRARLEKTGSSSGLSRQVIASGAAEAGRLDPALIVPENLPLPAQTIAKFPRSGSASGGAPSGDKEAWSDILPSLKSALTGRPPAPNQGLTIVVFDEQYLIQDFIPGLVEKYFGGVPRSAYTVTILQTEGGENVLYQSDRAREDTDLARGDVVYGLFAVRLDELAGVILDKAPQLSGLANKAIARSPQRSSSSGSLASPGAATQILDGVWKVVVKHKAGSLDAAVASTRRKNLAISFGILIVLGAAMSLMLVATYRARKLARQQVEFVAGVSHEFRTPLAVICSAGENLADGVIETDAQVKQYGKLIESEGKRLTQMMEQVLEFAGVQSGSRVIVPRPVNPVEVMDRALASCRLLLDEGQFAVERHIEPSIPRVLADADSLERSIQNLLSNAMKYGGPDRWIGIKARVAEASQAEVEITIEDRGMGIPAGELSSIFKPFYRGKAALAAQIHGNGLGLSLVKHFVQAAGGRITVKSTPERGSCFTLHLPVAPPDPAERAAAEERAGQSAGSPEFGT